MEVENKQEKTDEKTAACASAPAAAKKKKSVKEVLLFFLVSAGTGLIGIGTFTLLSKLNPFVQDVLKGVVMVGAVALDVLRNRRK